MSIKEQLDQDIKTAMLSGDKVLTTTLRGLKASILSVEVAKGLRETGLPDAEIIELFTKEAKKRQESADLFQQGGNAQKAQDELAEKDVIARYLPAQMTDDELTIVVDEIITSLGGTISQAQMGQAISLVKQRVGPSVEGGRIAVAVKTRIS